MTHPLGLARAASRPRRSGRCWLLAAVLACAGCAVVRTDRGVDTLWHDVAGFERGKTTRNEVLARLGPPSQMLALERETVLYYMQERTRGRSVKLFVYNYRGENTRYDRAVFFFDLAGVLTDYSMTDALP